MDKNEIINNYGKIEFEEYLKNNNILELLDEEGLNILYDSFRRDERIDYILAFSPQLKELFQNELFLEVFLNSRMSHFCINMEKLDKDSVNIIMNKLFSLNKSTGEIAKVFAYFNSEIKDEIIASKTLPTELIYEIFETGRNNDKQSILNNYDIDLSHKRIDLYGLFYNAKQTVLRRARNINLGLTNTEGISIPSTLITKEVAEKAWNNYNIFEVREIINMAEYSTDPEVINNYVKLQEQNIIENALSNNYVSPIKEIYESAYKYYEIDSYLRDNQDKLTDDEMNKLWTQCREFHRSYVRHPYHQFNKNLYKKLEEKYNEEGLTGVIEVLDNENSKMLSNYIIDYHFEENYHNIKLDVDELLGFYFRGNISLDEDFISIYQRVSNIDYLSTEEKLELHEELKQYNMIEKFYDDMSFARKIVRETIKDYSLTSESLEEYLDPALTEEYGVNIYNVKEEPFFGIVKSGSHRLDNLPTGHSFSLVGNNCVSIFGNPDDSNTYLYDAEELNPEQIVHVYPRDSFTIYKPFDSVDTPTNKINMLLTAPELINASSSYNEILILEQGYKPHEIDKDIQSLKRIALYCIDKITEKDIIEAKKEGVGIILVSAKSYDKDFNPVDTRISTELLWEYNYFNGISDREKFESRRI